MAMKCPNIFCCKTLQKLPKIWHFWFENMPSGHPAVYLSTPMAWEAKQARTSAENPADLIFLTSGRRVSGAEPRTN
jgi:hypothetical protein